jgi:proteasome accessory factor PafA2
MQKSVAPWSICFGLETELGISVVEDPGADVVEESIQLVRSAIQHGAPNLWDYASEDPHLDARGFRVKELLQDTDEAGYVSLDSRRPMSFQEIKSDLVLRNGARLYNDHAHPEYSTPECATLAELVAQDKAGEHILEECARLASRKRGKTIRLYKNNTDFLGHSYGCHENYLISRATPWERLVQGMTPFLVTRQLFAGAGKVGWECEDQAIGGGFQISQRADFFTELVSIDTMNRRPLINTRDEPHADPAQYRRFHVIVGDANMSEYSTWLKVGSTALVLEALALDPAPSKWELADPVRSHRALSRDETFRWELPLAGSGSTTGVQLQLEYVEWVGKRVDLSHPEKRLVWETWRQVLEQLERDPSMLRDRLDWVAKRWLLDAFREKEGLTWQDGWLQSLDLEYHLLKRDEGLFYALESAGDMKRVIGEAEVIHALQQPPTSTRAYIRGRCVQKFPQSLTSAQWDQVTFQVGGRSYRLDLAQAFPGPSLDLMKKAVDTAETVEDLIRLLPLAPLP